MNYQLLEEKAVHVKRALKSEYYVTSKKRMNRDTLGECCKVG